MDVQIIEIYFYVLLSIIYCDYKHIIMHHVLHAYNGLYERIFICTSHSVFGFHEILLWYVQYNGDTVNVNVRKRGWC